MGKDEGRKFVEWWKLVRRGEGETRERISQNWAGTLRFEGHQMDQAS